jgi:hypothetical protein
VLSPASAILTLCAFPTQQKLGRLFRELPVGPAEILIFSGSVSAFGGRALKESNEILFVSADGVRLAIEMRAAFADSRKRKRRKP